MKIYRYLSAVFLVLTAGITAPVHAAETNRQTQAIQPVKATPAGDVDGKSYDLVVVGGTPGGIACAVRAAREGLSVLLVQHNRHLGGMLTNGLMQWDALYAGHRAPIFNEVAKAIESYYLKVYGENSTQYKRAKFTQNHYPLSHFEPSVVEHCLNTLVSAEPKISVLLSHIPDSVTREGAQIKALTLCEYGTTKKITVRGDIYADATYEGDLAAKAGVPCRIGREGRDETGEPHAGVVFTDIEREKGPVDAVEGRLNIRPYNHRQKKVDPESPYTADNAIQAYNYRFCLSSDPDNLRLPEKPAGYDRNEYIHYNRKGMGKGLLNGKATFNNAILPGENHDYPEADWPAREKIIERHKNFALGLIYYLQNDPSVPEDRREYFRGIGLPLDEYTDNDNIPYEMYVREARRIAGRFLFREQDNVLASDYARTPVFADSIAITDWSMDSHACTTNTRPGFPYDGKLILAEESRPAQIPYKTLLPQGVDNLLVPVCLSATHVAWGAVRLEPVWMQTGEAAGFAAALAVKKNTTPAALDPDLLIRTLVKNHFMVSFFNDVDVTSRESWVPAVEYFGTRGFFASYDAKPDALLSEVLATVWARGFVQLRDGNLDPGALAREVAEAESNTSLESVATTCFLAMIENTKTSHNADPLTRKTACQLMFKILER